ncbi:MAG TPA: PP2C family protein-serine/threonine phosphatase, partial [Vicinamibacterales bacterium]|nr:PP2C family protein-serine/threonine phosphatase [Vicinamibacterales bacterium]
MHRRPQSADLRTLLRLLSTRDARQFLAGLPARALLPLAAAVFSMFAVMGFIIDIMAAGRHPVSLLVSNVLFSGGIGVAYAYSGLRGMRERVAAVAVHLTYVLVVPVLFGDAAPEPDFGRLRFDSFAIIVCIAISYTFFLRFIGTTGLQYLSARAEIRLAAEIHAVLVPVIDSRLGEYEFYGLARASGDVGGDLVDVVGTGSDRWIGYVADVSGHGVSSGVLMGMTKSAARMRLRDDASLAELLNALNAVLYPLKRPSMFVTFAGVRDTGDGRLEFAVAGHLPVLRVTAAGAVVELTTPQIPLGIFEDYRFTSGTLASDRGDLLALVTDGLTETFDAADQEYGFQRVKDYLRAHAGEPLPDLARGLLADVAAHGAQMDDQTLLLIRR